MKKRPFNSPHEGSNVVVFPYPTLKNNSVRCSSSKPDIDLIKRCLLLEIAKLDVLCDEVSDLPQDKIQDFIAKRADALKIIWFNMRFLK